jgi:hypothetical protein
VEQRWNPSTPPFAERLAVVAGQCSKVGKTSLVTDLIAASGDLDWTAVKITPHVEWSAANDRAVEIREEQDRSGRTDTSRFLRAGAKKAFWVQAKPGSVHEVIAPLAKLLSAARYIIIESNAILEFWYPAMAAVVLDPLNPNFKPSAEFAISLADVFVFRSPLSVAEVPNSRVAELPARPTFLQHFGEPLPVGVQELTRRLFGLDGHPHVGPRRGTVPSFRG